MTTGSHKSAAMPILALLLSAFLGLGCPGDDVADAMDGTDGDTQPQNILEAIFGFQVQDFAQYTLAAPTGVETCNSNPDIPKTIPQGSEETFQIGYLVAPLDQEQLDDAFTGSTPAFPVGMGNMGLTLQAEMPATMIPGTYLFAWQCTVDEIPLNDPVRWFQRAYVADGDRNVANNFQAVPPFEDDTFDNTDTWYSAEYNLTDDWSLQVTDAINGMVAPKLSAARVIMYGVVQFFVIPVSEFDGSSAITGRYTAFAHEGDFGQRGGPWSLDATPRVDEPQIQIELQPSF